MAKVIRASCPKCGWKGPNRCEDAPDEGKARTYAAGDLCYHRHKNCKTGPNY